MTATGGEGASDPESAIALPHEHRDIIGRKVGDRQIDYPVAVEVASGNGYRLESNRKVLALNEGYRSCRNRNCRREQQNCCDELRSRR